MSTQLSGEWLQRLQRLSQAEPGHPRLPLVWQGHTLGSVDPRLLAHIALAAPSQLPTMLQKEERDGHIQWRLQGHIGATLEQLAALLRQLDLGHVRAQWRDELLTVCDADTLQPLGRVERGIVRLLGLTTHAVHLVGFDHRGYHWVQQRSLSKATDPGLWDTLMGGMINAGDSLDGALEREAWEEAGLRLEDLQDLQHGGQVWLRKPHTLDGGLGYVVERVDWFCTTLREGCVPHNQDGEVAQFACWSPSELNLHLQQEALTTEAAIVLVAALARPLH